MLFFPIFNFVCAEHFIHKYRVTYQRQLEQGGILTKVNDTKVHSRILHNTFTSLNWQIQNSFKHLYVLNLHIQFDNLSLIAKPDLAITAPCEVFPVLHPVIPINPVIIIEVLSQHDEREQKFNEYRKIASLREYVRIETNHYLIEHLVQQPGMEWNRSQIKNWEDKVPLASIDANLSLDAVYYQVDIGTDKGDNNPDCL